MAGNTPSIRFVRCPNCSQVLAENPDIPVYRCGGCDTVLRAKNRVPNVDGGISSGSLENNMQNQSDISSLNRENTTAAKQQTEDQLAVERSEGPDNKPEERIHSLDEQSKKSMDLSPKGSDNSRSSDKLERSAESSGVNATLSEDDVKLAAGSSHSYYGSSSSSPDVSRENCVVPNKYLLLSRRTFRNRKVLDSVDSIEKGAKVQAPGPHVHELERDATFGSEDYHSVENRMVSGPDERASKSPAKDHLLHQNDKREAKFDRPEPDPMKILKKVDELRDELSGFLTRTLVENREYRPKDRCSHIPTYPYKARKEEDGALKLNSKEKKPSPIKSYCRPVSNGAPFVICYKCYKLLQLPADFLVTRKRLHKLKCGACSQVLVFSFRPQPRNAPVTPTEARHPPSEADNRDPNSYSDDYGISFARSHSSGAEPEGTLNASRNSSYTAEAKGSRLHRLMGYSSASELLFRPGGAVDGGYQSTEPSTPHFYRPPEFEETEEEEEPSERLRTGRRRRALQGLLKKGVRHGIESVKMRIHSNG